MSTPALPDHLATVTFEVTIEKHPQRGLGLNVVSSPQGVQVWGFPDDAVTRQGPAQRLGVFRRGDIILQVNGVDVQGKPFDTVVQMLKNSQGGVTLRLYRRTTVRALGQAHMTSATIVEEAGWYNVRLLANGMEYVMGPYQTTAIAQEAYSKLAAHVSTLMKEQRSTRPQNHPMLQNSQLNAAAVAARRQQQLQQQAQQQQAQQQAQRRPAAHPATLVQVIASVSTAQAYQLQSQIYALKTLLTGQAPPPNILIAALTVGRPQDVATARSNLFQPRARGSGSGGPKRILKSKKNRKKNRDSDADSDPASDDDQDYGGMRAGKNAAPVRRSSRNAGTRKTYKFEVELSEPEEEKSAGGSERSASPQQGQKINIDKFLGVRFGSEGGGNFSREEGALEYLIKYKHVSYLHTEWVTAGFLKDMGAASVRRMRKFASSPEAIAQLDEEEAEERAFRSKQAKGIVHDREYKDNTEYFNPMYIEVDRVLDVKELQLDDGIRALDAHTVAISSPEELAEHATGVNTRQARVLFVKWMELSYQDSTWEWEEDVDAPAKMAQYMRWNTPPSTTRLHPATLQDVRPPPSEWAKYVESPVYKGGRTLRPYQIEGLNWIVFNWYNKRNCILADEMGLGKTVQTVSVMEHLRTREHVRGPFLIVAPLSTIAHWKREFEDWTDMNCIVFYDNGGQPARDMIREYEFRFRQKGAAKLPFYKFHCIVVPYNVLRQEWEVFAEIHWRYLVVDEAHNIRNRDTIIMQVVQNLQHDSLLLLTGTPLHNNVNELWTLLHLVDPGRFESSEAFVAKYGDLHNAEQLGSLQADLRPYLLRRVKEDVEKSIPPKEETIVHVELTALQKKYYRAIFERNRHFLTKGVNKLRIAQLLNIEMELRKCCNHPFLLRHFETIEVDGAHASRDELLVKCSGKMAFLAKLLPRLRADKHKVLIFSQFLGMLSLLEDYCKLESYPYERLDGGLQGHERQAAIDRFNDKDGDGFIFLLSTRAGGVGINLTGADTVIIFDSDWNPQNDVQAMARCHRIGQTASVNIYRLITKKTYEAEMFRRAGMKLGLHQAILETGGVQQSFSGAAPEQGLTALLKLDKDKVETLLRFGAYAVMDDEDNDEEAVEDIDQLLNSSIKIRYDNAAGNPEGAGGVLTFNKASFVASTEDEKLDVKDPEFWEKVLGPKPADRLLADLTSGKLDSASEEQINTFVNTLVNLIEDVITSRQEGVVHEDAERAQEVLIELRERNGKLKLPTNNPERTKAVVTMGDLSGVLVSRLNQRKRRRVGTTVAASAAADGPVKRRPGRKPGRKPRKAAGDDEDGAGAEGGDDGDEAVPTPAKKPRKPRKPRAKKGAAAPEAALAAAEEDVDVEASGAAADAAAPTGAPAAADAADEEEGEPTPRGRQSRGATPAAAAVAAEHDDEEEDVDDEEEEEDEEDGSDEDFAPNDDE